MLPEVAPNAAEHARLLEDGPAIPVSYGSRPVVLIYCVFIVDLFC